MHWFFQLLLACVGGYTFTCVCSYWIVLQTSPRHDRQLEAAMSSIFVFGPIGAVLSCLIAIGRMIF